MGSFVNRAVADVVAAGNLAHRLAVDVTPANCLALLVLGQFRLATKFDAARFSPLAPFPGPRADQIALELR